ncbi:MAG: UvrD-helicase domain-containing protein [Bacteroidales bacterium]|nr:UvrD-helicase domain-containing protein [Bacteroidales bacterium]
MSGNLLKELNGEQRDAVECIEGPMMVIAGAGSGKTRVLTYRIAYMIAQGINPFNILSLTFTNKAAEEMKERVMSLLGNTAGRNVWMGTFHSVFSKILHIESQWLGFTQNFSIYDTNDSKNLIKNIIKEKNLDTNVYKQGLIAAKISSAKASLLSPEDYCDNYLINEENRYKKIPETGNIYRTYNQRLKQFDAMDFDDLLVNMYILLRDFPDLLYKYQHKFKYILVDEYQDTNYVQYQIIKKLAAAYENICVVGDDAQSIYAFRGANINNILNFKDDYPDYNIFKLEQNYRSTKNIIHAANSLIKHNKKQIPKIIWTANSFGEKIKVIRTNDENEEAIAVVRSIQEDKIKHNLSNKDFTILYRTNAQSRPFEETLRRAELPYRIYGGISFYSRKEIKDVLAYFRLAINFRDEEALRRIINYPQRGIGATTIEKIIVAAAENNTIMWNVIENPQLYGLKIGQSVRISLENFVTKIKSYQADLLKKNAFELGKHIADNSGISRDLREQTEEKERYENLGELFNAMQNFVNRPPQYRIDLETGEELEEIFPSLTLFLNEVALYTDADKNEKDDNNKIKLMTIHSAKGLEFPFTYIVGLEENLLPFYLIETQDDLEEERRLFYVAITRAKQSLTFSLAQRRLVFGNYQVTRPSPFLMEIDPSVLEIVSSSYERNNFPQKSAYPSQNKSPFPQTQDKPPSPQKGQLVYQKQIYQTPTPISPSSETEGNINIDANVQLGEMITQISQITIGMRVFHSKFGLGTVTDISDDKKIIIDFDESGTKTILINYAKLRTVV